MATPIPVNVRQPAQSPIAPRATNQKAASREDIRLAHLEALANWLDTAFRVPGIGLRFGLDALLDLIPGIGDAIGALFSLYIMQAARQFGVPRITLVRMAVNIAVDYVGGLVPFAGAIFDAYWKANIWNVALIKRHVNNPTRSRANQSGDLFFLLLVFAVFFLVIAATTALTVWLVSLLIHALR